MDKPLWELKALSSGQLALNNLDNRDSSLFSLVELPLTVSLEPCKSISLVLKVPAL
jgi:hypothetical protein